MCCQLLRKIIVTHPSVCNKKTIMDKPLVGGLVNVNSAEHHVLSMSLLDIPRETI